MSKTMKAIVYLLLVLIMVFVAAAAFGQSPQTYHEPQPYHASPSSQTMDYGLIGALALGVLGLLAFTVKADRGDRLRLIEAITNLSKTQETLATELRHGFLSVNSKVELLHKDLKELQEEFKRR
jgi:hypothetical protein